MRAHVLQHAPFEGIGSMDRWLRELHAEVTFTRYYETSALPSPEDIDLLIIMGGPMSVNDEHLFDWLTPEKRFIREVIDLEIPVLGICLGAQLIASALGARVYPNSEREIGWFPIARVDSSQPALGVFQFPGEMTVFHWHGDTFDLPVGSTLLASSPGCKQQAFQYGSRALGLQFHLESTPETMSQMLSNCRSELVPARYVQSEDQLLSVPPSAYAQINELMGRVLDYLIEGALPR